MTHATHMHDSRLQWVVWTRCLLSRVVGCKPTQLEAAVPLLLHFNCTSYSTLKLHFNCTANNSTRAFTWRSKYYGDHTATAAQLEGELGTEVINLTANRKLFMYTYCLVVVWLSVFLVCLNKAPPLPFCFNTVLAYSEFP
jgi:hypothetical protein